MDFAGCKKCALMNEGSDEGYCKNKLEVTAARTAKLNAFASNVKFLSYENSSCSMACNIKALKGI